MTRDIAVSRVGRPVISNLETSPLSYQAGTAPVPVTGTLTLSDVGTGLLAGAEVSITAGFDPGTDTLSFTSQHGIAGSYNASPGVLRLTGPASLADYQAALRSVEFSTDDPSAAPAARTVVFAVTDSLGAASNTPSRTIDVTGATRPPTVVNHAYSAVGNTPLAVGTTVTGPAATLSGSVLDGDSDSDPSATLSAAEVSPPAHGTLTLNPDGTFTYLPAVGFSGTDSFTVAVAGSNDPSLTATATITINVGTLVWYVKGAAPDGYGNGSADSPFADLAAAVGQGGAARANSVIFLYQGSYGVLHVGVMMQPGEDLYGQPHGLTVGGHSLVAPGGSTPTIDNLAADGIDLAEGVDVEGVDVQDPLVNGIVANDVNNATVGATTPVLVQDAGAGIGINVNGGGGQLNFGGTTVTGAALNVQGTTIGAAGLDFQAISSNGGQNGIDLDDTGSAGGLAVTGTGTAGSGGTIQNASGAGIELSSTHDPSFTDMLIEGNAGDGINGVQVDGLTLAASTVSGNGTLADVANDATNEDGLNFAGGLDGTVSITDSTLTGSADNNAIITAGSGTLGLTVTGDTFSANNASTGWAGLELNTNGTSATITADDDNFQNIARNSIQITAIGGTLTGTVNDNTIGTPTVADSGGTAGLQLILDGAGTGTLTVSGNHIYQYDNQAGLDFEGGVGGADLNLTATGNTIEDPGTYAKAGIIGIDGGGPGDSGTVCAAISGNSIAGSGHTGLGGADIWLQQYYQTTFELPGYTGGDTDAAAVESFLQANNDANGTPTASVQVADGFTGGSSC